MHAGMVASLIFNANRRKGTRAASMGDFMLIDPVTRRERETRDTIAAMRSMAVPKR